MSAEIFITPNSRGELRKQRLDIFSGFLMGFCGIASGVEALSVKYKFYDIETGNFSIWDIVFFASLIPCAVGAIWLAARCHERRDFTQLPSTRLTLLIAGCGVLLTVVSLII
jgi:hypothetical protein